MPKTLFLPPGPASRRSGIDIVFRKRSNRISIGGWYDGYVGIESTDMLLREFFDALGITEKDCKKAFKGDIKNV